MSFIAQRPIKSAASDVTDVDDGDEAISGGNFWPVVKLSDLRLAARIAGDVTTSRLKHVATEGFIHVCDQLADWKKGQELQGLTTLAEVPSDTVNNENMKVYRFRRAVYSLARAYVLEGYRDVSTTPKGDKDAEALDRQIGDLWRDARFSIADIQELPRLYSELC